MLRNLTVAAVFLANVVATAPAAFALDEHNVSAGLTAVGAPLGLHGVDPVAFIDLGNRIEGSARHAAVHDGVAFYFDTQANMDAFKANPAAYRPQNGGFCTFGVSVGKKFDGDPQYAEIVDGKLYVFLNEEIFRMFQKDRSGTIAKAAKNWPEIEHTAATEL